MGRSSRRSEVRPARAGGRSRLHDHTATSPCPRGVAVAESVEPRYLFSTIQVTTALDTVNASDGVTSLREALTQAASLGGTDDIVFDTGLAGATITLDPARGQLDINSDVTIQAPAAGRVTIRRDPAAVTQFRLAIVQMNRVVQISGLNFTGGAISGSSGGGILTVNSSTTTLTDCTISGNSADDGGGGIFASGSLTMNRCTVSGNVVNSSSTERGGGIWGGNLTLTDCLIAGNTVAGTGGGVYASGLLIATGSTFLENAATGTFAAGGGLYLDGNTLLANCTIAGNTSAGDGGGIKVWSSASNTHDFTNCTITANRAQTTLSAGGGVRRISGIVRLNNTIVAGNFRNVTGTTADDLNGTFSTASSSNNLIGAAGGGFTNGTNGNLAGTSAAPLDPRLAPLAYNGPASRAPTHALLPNSPAIDAGSNARAADPNNDGNTADALTIDQRGGVRTRDGNSDTTVIVDIGAHEFDPADGFAPLVATLTASPDPTVPGDAAGITLTAAGVSDLDAGGVVARVDFYRETNGITGYQGGAGGDLLVASDTDAAGGWTAAASVAALPPGLYTYYAIATDNAGASSDRYVGIASYVHTVIPPITVTILADEDDGDRSAGDISFREAVLIAASQTGADVIRFDPALTAAGPAAIELATGQIALSGDVRIEGPGASLLTIRRAAAAPASRILLVSGGNVTLSGLTLSGGAATDAAGGAIRATGGARLTLLGCAVTGNSSSFAGGGIFVDGASGTTLTMEDSFVSRNAAGAGQSGGGIATANSAIVNITRSNIENNTSSASAGGIHGAGTFTITDTIIAANTAATNAGALFAAGGVFTLRNCTFFGNSAGDAGGGIYAGGGATTALVSLANCTISGNTAARGGAVFAADAMVTMTMVNATITDNVGSAAGSGGLHRAAGTVRLHNTILAGNRRDTGTPDDVSGAVDAASSFNFLGVAGTSGLTDGVNGNRAGSAAAPLDPILAPLAHSGPRRTPTHALRPGSPAIDAGSDARAADPDGNGNTADALVIDQRGVSRTLDRLPATASDVDIGAFEFDAADPNLPPVIASLTTSPQPAVFGDDSAVTLIASGVSDFDAGDAIVRVDFYRESNGIAGLQSGAGGDAIVGTDSTPDAGNWSASASLAGLPGGYYTYYAAAVDSRGASGDRWIWDTATAHRILAPFIVTTLADVNLPNPGPGAYSLRDAIAAAAAQPGFDIIRFDPALTASPQTLLALNHFGINDNVSVQGPGADRLTIRRSNQAGNVRLFTITGGTVGIAGLTITGGYVEFSAGGGIYTQGATTTITDCVVTSNTAYTNADDGYGGGIAANGGTLNLIRSTITNNSTGGLGGGVYSEFCTVNLTDTTISSNNSEDGGAGIYTFQAGLSLDGATISGNVTNGSGGGISASVLSPTTPRPTLSIRNSSINGNRASGNGGGIAADGQVITLDTASFTSNVSLSTGLADGGGAIYAWQSTITGSDATVTDNNSNAEGGGIAVRFGSLDLAGSRFLRNTSQTNGGGIDANDSPITLTDCIVSDNTSNTAGGGGVAGGTVTLTDCTFSGNRAVTGGGGAGGSALTVNRCTFSGNSVSGAGGVGGGVSAGASSFTDCTFTDNHATGTGGNGGGALARGSFTRCTFTANTAAGNAGGLLVTSGDTTLLDCTIAGNSSAGTGTSAGGGGLYVTGSFAFAVALRNCTISGNTSAANGGGVYAAAPFAQVSVALDNTTLSGNTSTSGQGGGLFSQFIPLQLTNVTVTANRAASGGGILRSNGAVTINNTIVAGNFQGQTTTPNDLAGTLAAASGNNLIATPAVPIDPVLGALADNGGPTLTHLPQPTSPARNTGSNAAAAARSLTTDQRGLTRIAQGTVDIGAVEVQASPPSVVSVAVNDGAAQRSQVTSITVTFDQPVVLDADAIGVAGRNGAGAGVAALVDNPLGDGATWRVRFSGAGVIGGSLPDGIYDLTVAAAKVHAGSAAGPAMAADHAFEFHRLYSDADGDGDSDNADLFQMRGTYGKFESDPAYRWWFDYEADGDVDNADVFQVRSRRNIVFKDY